MWILTLPLDFISSKPLIYRQPINQWLWWCEYWLFHWISYPSSSFSFSSFSHPLHLLELLWNCHLRNIKRCITHHGIIHGSVLEPERRTCFFVHFWTHTIWIVYPTTVKRKKRTSLKFSIFQIFGGPIVALASTSAQVQKVFKTWKETNTPDIYPRRKCAKFQPNPTSESRGYPKVFPDRQIVLDSSST